MISLLLLVSLLLVSLMLLLLLVSLLIMIPLRTVGISSVAPAPVGVWAAPNVARIPAAEASDFMPKSKIRQKKVHVEKQRPPDSDEKE